MRTIDQIKENIAADFMRNEAVADLFEFPVGSDFAAHFSKASVINILFYIFACASWTLEKLFETHKQEVETMIEEIIPHRPKWYQAMTLKFMRDKALVPETDRYDTSTMTDAEIASARVVRHAVADENKDSSIVTIKVAGESGGKRCPLSEEVAEQLAAYIAEFKDAGVRIALVNIEPDLFKCEVDIYYDPMLLPENVKNQCEQTIKSYIENLPFNGEYSNMALVDVLQTVEGVKIVEFRGASSSANGLEMTGINARRVPEAGYFKPETLTLNMKVYE